jgi:dTDP-4-amino-4,6-dideoxygalactose transaminase
MIGVSLSWRLVEVGSADYIYKLRTQELASQFLNKKKAPELPLAEALAEQVLSLPIGPHDADEDICTVSGLLSNDQSSRESIRGRP